MNGRGSLVPRLCEEAGRARYNPPPSARPPALLHGALAPLVAASRRAAPRGAEAGLLSEKHRPHVDVVVARLVRPEQAGEAEQAPLARAESQQLAHSIAPSRLTIDEISRVLVFRDGRARLYTSHASRGS